MAYTDFTLESAEVELGVACVPSDLFPDLVTPFIDNVGNLLAAFARAVGGESPSRTSP